MSATVVRQRPSRAALLAAAASVAISIVLVVLDARGGGKASPAGSGPDLPESPPAQVIHSDIKLAY